MYIMYLGLTTTTSRAEKAEREARKMWAAIKSKLQSTTNYPVVQLSEVTTSAWWYTGHTTNAFGSCKLGESTAVFFPSSLFRSTRTVPIAFFLGGTGTKATLNGARRGRLCSGCSFKDVSRGFSLSAGFILAIGPWGSHFRAPFTALTQNFCGIIFRITEIPQSHTLK